MVFPILAQTPKQAAVPLESRQNSLKGNLVFSKYSGKKNFRIHILFIDNRVL